MFAARAVSSRTAEWGVIASSFMPLLRAVPSPLSSLIRSSYDSHKWSDDTVRRSHSSTEQRGTTVLCVRKGDSVVLIADGQVTLGSAVVKPNVKKTRRIGDQAIGGFAGATADAFTLFERLETKLEEHPGQLTRAAVELAKMWRMDKYLRRLDAALIIADKSQSLQITGTGDVLEPHDGIISIGSGSPYALAAARALIDIPGMDALTIAKKAMNIASEACIYTNSNFTTLKMDAEGNITEPVDTNETIE